MKKLMIAAAAAALIGGVEAGVAQVYDYKMTVKTTVCKDNKNSITDAQGNTYRFYRAQTSYKFEGKFWGCGCAVIGNPICEQYAQPWLSDTDVEDLVCDKNNNSYVIWGKNDCFANAEFSWSLLQLVGKKHENIEGVFTLRCYVRDDDGIKTDPSLDVTGAGYGTAKIYENIIQDETTYRNPQNYIKSMSGYFAGVYNIVDLAGYVGCAYCGYTTTCSPVPFCNCAAAEAEQSAAYGSWSIKYNSSLTKKVNNGDQITDAYKFSDAVKAEFLLHSTDAE